MPRFLPAAPRTTPLMEGQHWRRWGGYVTASSYELSHDREYAAIRNAAALIDVTPLYKYVIHGKDALRLVDRVMTRDIHKCAVGQVMYGPWCDSAGKIIDDGTVSRLAEDRFRLTSADPSLLWLSKNAVGMDVAIDDVTDRLAAFSLQGPRSRAILAGITEGDVAALKYFRFLETTLGGIPVTISRTGYTGDLGYEIWMPTECAVDVWDAVTNAGAKHGIAPCGIWAMDIARIEAGLVMNDVDYVSSHKALIPSQKSSPYELGLGWAVSLGSGSFVGKRALVEEKAAGPSWQLVGVEIDWESLEQCFREVGLPPRLPNVAWRTSVPLYGSGRQVGYATSGTWSPLLKRLIALAHVEVAWSKPGTEIQIEVTVEHRRRQALARVAPLPFFDPERKRA